MVIGIQNIFSFLFTLLNFTRVCLHSNFAPLEGGASVLLLLLHLFLLLWGSTLECCSSFAPHVNCLISFLKGIIQFCSNPVPFHLKSASFLVRDEAESQEPNKKRTSSPTLSSIDFLCYHIMVTLSYQYFNIGFLKHISQCSLIKQLIFSHFDTSYLIVVIDGLTIICRQSNLHYNNSYKNYFLITDIIINY